jgi:hypothetical protein
VVLKVLDGITGNNSQNPPRILMYKIIKKNDMKNPLETACLKLVSEIEKCKESKSERGVA